MPRPAPTPSSAAELEAVYAELRRVARRLLRREPYDHTLESCELVNQAYARLLDGDLRDTTLADPNQIIALAITNMRRELIDHARRRRAAKRPDAKIRISFEDAPLMSHSNPDTFLEVDMLLDELGAGGGRVRNGERKALVARYALYGGLSESEIATALDMPKSSVGNDVRFVKAWLTARLEKP